VLPARAGMILVLSGVFSMVASAPRACGDDPTQNKSMFARY